MPMNVPLYEARLLSVEICADTRLFINMRLVDSDVTYFLWRRGMIACFPRLQ